MVQAKGTEVLGQRHSSGGCLPTQGTGASSGSSLEMLFRVTPAGGLAPTWTLGAHTSSGAAGVGSGAFLACVVLTPGEAVSEGWGSRGAGCVPLPAAGHGGGFSPDPPPPALGCCWVRAFWSVFAAGEAAPRSGSPTPSASFLLPQLSLPLGRAWPRPIKGHRFRGPGGSSTALPGHRGLCLQATPLQPVSGGLSVTQPRPSCWAKPRRGDEAVDGPRPLGLRVALRLRPSLLLCASWFMYEALYEAAGINDRHIQLTGIVYR